MLLVHKPEGLYALYKTAKKNTESKNMNIIHYKLTLQS